MRRLFHLCIRFAGILLAIGPARARANPLMSSGHQCSGRWLNA
jgi:hypothetical protein